MLAIQHCSPLVLNAAVTAAAAKLLDLQLSTKQQPHCWRDMTSTTLHVHPALPNRQIRARTFHESSVVHLPADAAHKHLVLWPGILVIRHAEDCLQY